jgi:myo-inositol 2-dehydrogenase / D-chiro-inositol 1-dehydrogenase
MVMKVGLLGAGFIGRVHAASVFLSPHGELARVFDVRRESAQEVAGRYGAAVATDPKEIIEASDIDAVVIASSTDTHADFLIRTVQAGKPVYCEKPIDLHIDRLREVADVVRSTNGRVFMGFSRRFDRSYADVQARVADIGRIELVQMVTRGPQVPPIAYVKVSGGQFRDQTIHFFDMLRWVTGQEPVEVYATGVALVDPAVGEAGDIDTSMLIITLSGGGFASIDNSRRAAFGYDERIELFGSLGMVHSERLLTSGVVHYDASGRRTAGAHDSWFTRVEQSFPVAMNRFLQSAADGTPMSPGFEDGVKAQEIAEAAVQSLHDHRPVAIEYTI